MMVARSRFSALAVLSCCAAACQADPEAALLATPSVAAEAPANVAVRVAKDAMVPTWVPITGTLIAEQRTQLTAGAAGRVEATHVERGQEVQRGEPLITLDVRQARHGDKEAQANLRNLRTQRATSQADCRRYDALYQKQAVSEQEHERMTAQCRELDAQLEAAEARAAEAARSLSDGQVRAPYPGVVTERTVQVGDYVQPSSPVLTLVKRDPLRLRATVPEAEAAFALAKHKVSFEVAAYRGRSFVGELRYLSGEVREQTRDVVFEATVDNKDRALLPGMFVRGRLYGDARPRPSVPPGALIHENERAYLFLVVDQRLQKHLVRQGEALAEGGEVAIEEGLKAGDVYVAAPTPQLVDGQAITPKD